VGGGYILAREPSQITLGDIVSAVDGPIAVGDFGEPHQDGACDHEGQCVLLAVWAGLSSRIRAELDSFTLADIASMSKGKREWPEARADVVPGPV
jgi:Rrf2 family iron-sulfur cluster assembly transcriptional regulator